jgi:hypothetical protein
MFIQDCISLFNNGIIYLFVFIYKYCNIETVEDKFHKEKKGKKIMNKVKLEFTTENEFNRVKQKTLEIISNPYFLQKYDISLDTILHDNNNKITVSFKDKCIYVCFNHYYVSGPNMFILLNEMVNSKPPRFLQTNPFYGILYLPFYIYNILSLKKREYVRAEKKREHLIVERKIATPNKRCYLYLSILQKIYHSLQLDRPMIAALSVAFEELPYITNNVGLVILTYEISDTIETLEHKLKNAYYQAYCSNFIVNCPLPNMGNFELRDYVDCVISSMYITSDLDFKVAWNCSKPPVEQMYVGSVSILHSDNTMTINMCLNTCSSNYNNCYDYIDHYFE